MPDFAGSIARIVDTAETCEFIERIMAMKRLTNVGEKLDELAGALADRSRREPKATRRPRAKVTRVIGDRADQVAKRVRTSDRKKASKRRGR